jgi:uncharacterized damage-inducible protein DinB
MSRTLLEDAFEHHVWATLRLIDTCLTLSPSELERAVPGTYGTILDTQRHVVGSDSWYLFDVTGDRARRIEEDLMDLPELRTAMERDGEAWSALLAKDPDPDAVLKDVDEALHHGTDHRSQICTTLTSLGVEPPGIDVWNFGVEVGRVVDVQLPRS